MSNYDTVLLETQDAAEMLLARLLLAAACFTVCRLPMNLQMTRMRPVIAQACTPRMCDVLL